MDLVAGFRHIFVRHNWPPNDRVPYLLHGIVSILRFGLPVVMAFVDENHVRVLARAYCVRYDNSDSYLHLPI